MKRISILIVALLALVVAACSSQQGASPTATEPEAVATAEPTPEPASESPDPTDDANGSTDDGTALADLFPDELNGAPRNDIPGMDAMIASALAAQGMDASGAEFVLATYGEGADAITVNAFRIPEVDQTSLEMLARAMSGVQGDGTAAAETVTIGGKTVLRMTGTGADGAAYLYFTNDAVFTVVGPSEDLAEQLLAELP